MSGHTPGPWRWELNESSKSLRFVVAENNKLVEQLQVCADVFRAYEMHHRSKGDDQKADVNMKLADDALSAIKSAEAGVRHD